MKARTLFGRVLPALVAASLVLAFASTAMAIVPATPHAPLTVTAAGKTFTYATPESLITSQSVVDTPTIQGWVNNTIARQVDSSPVNAKYSVDKKHKKLVFTAAKVGYTLNRSGSVTAIVNELVAEVGGAPYATVALPTTTTQAKITSFGKNILVVLSQRKIYLYDNMSDAQKKNADIVFANHGHTKAKGK